MSAPSVFLLTVMSETISKFNETDILMAGLLVTGVVAVGLWGMARYTNKQDVSKQAASRSVDVVEQRVSVFKRDQSGKSLIQLLSPDQLVPSSQKIQETQLHLKDRSPWQGHVVLEEEQSAKQGNLSGLLEKLMSDAGLIVKYMRIYWSPYWVISVVSGICLMSKSVYQLLAAQKLGMAIDQGASTLVSSALQLATLLPIAFGLSLLGERLSARLSSRITNDIRYDLFTHLQTLSQEFHKKARLGNLLAHFSVDINKIEGAVGQEIVVGISDAIMILVNIGMMIRINGSLAIASLVPMAVTLPLIIYLMINASKQGLKSNNYNALMMDAVQEGMRGQPMILGYGLQSLFAGYFSDELKRLEDKKTEGQFSLKFFQQAAVFSTYLLSVWIIGVGGLYVLSGTITIGTWVVFFAISQNMYDSLVLLINIRIARWVESSIGMRRIDTILEQPAKIVDPVNAYPLPPFQQKICFEHLSFSYESQQQQLRDINLSIEAGQFVAFVGSSGAGKSTVFNLLMRFYDASDGRITVDGHDLRNVTQKSLRSQMGVVLQETFLFNTSIMDNIRIARPDATEEDVVAATQAAELHDFVLGLPNGYQTIVGEGGGRLSGGQRQRIAIARALLYNPAILLLDEATSSLSAEIADAVNQTIMALAGKHTVIMITHQLKAAIHADRIFVLDQGILIEEGTHDDLLLRDGHYRHLWDIQSNYLIKVLE
jgi:ATP-binding cassette subfamily B protein